MPTVKDPSQAAAKWARRAASAAGEYQEGVRNPKRSWAAATAAAETQYKAGVQAAMARGAFGKGVRKAGDAAWSKGAIEKGPGRFAEGVAVAEDKYRAGYEPYARILTGLTLPERGAKGDPKNIQRVALVAKALHDAKIGKAG